MFGCVSDQAQADNCLGYSHSNACSFAVAVGVIAFLLCLVLLVKDIILIIVDFSEAIKVGGVRLNRWGYPVFTEVAVTFYQFCD